VIVALALGALMVLARRAWGRSKLHRSASTAEGNLDRIHGHRRRFRLAAVRRRAAQLTLDRRN
jgi:hypothetical protein